MAHFSIFLFYIYSTPIILLYSFLCLANPCPILLLHFYLATNFLTFPYYPTTLYYASTSYLIFSHLLSSSLYLLTLYLLYTYLASDSTLYLFSSFLSSYTILLLLSMPYAMLLLLSMPYASLCYSYLLLPLRSSKPRRKPRASICSACAA